MAVGLSLGVLVKHFAKNEIKSTDLQITKKYCYFRTEKRF